MKILQVDNKYKFPGGTRTIVDDTTDLLRRNRVTVCLLTRNSGDLGSLLWGKLYAFGCGLYSLSAARDMTRMIREERPDVVHIHNLYPLFSPSVLVACQRAGVPVVLHCHSYYLTCPTTFHLVDGRICGQCCREREDCV